VASGEDKLASEDDLHACLTLDGPLDPQAGVRYAIGLDVGLGRDRTVAAVCHAEPIVGTDRRRVVLGLWDRKATDREGALPKGMRANADRFAGLDNTGSRVNVFNLARSVFRYVDRLNERPEVASKKTFVNVLVKARKPLTGARTRP
jgi:hypothetical protein